MDTTEYINERITATKAQIEAYEAAALALASDGILSYTIDTGQNRTTMTKQQLPSINKIIDSLYNRLTTLQARLSGNQTLGVPGW